MTICVNKILKRRVEKKKLPEVRIDSTSFGNKRNELGDERREGREKIKNKRAEKQDEMTRRHC